jgi:hypothetical protein
VKRAAWSDQAIPADDMIDGEPPSVEYDRGRRCTTATIDEQIQTVNIKDWDLTLGGWVSDPESGVVLDASSAAKLLPILQRFLARFGVVILLALAACHGASEPPAPDAAPLAACASLGCPGPFLSCTGPAETKRCYCQGQECAP